MKANLDIEADLRITVLSSASVLNRAEKGFQLICSNLISGLVRFVRFHILTAASMKFRIVF
jgi:hypothetical protein